MNPCGAVCDFGRRAYRTRCRFGVGGTLEAGIRWYAADHDAETMPLVSAIVNSDWEDNDLERDYGFDPTNLGEVRTADRVTAWRDMPQRHTGQHQCGEPAWYRSGVPPGAPGTPVVYGPDGIPTCCGPGRGILWGGKPGIPAGGLLWGGQSLTPIDGTDSCPGPVMAYGVEYEQTLRVMGAPGNGLWIRTPFLDHDSVVTVNDLGGVNPVAGYSLWGAPGGTCGSIFFVGAGVGSSFTVGLTLLTGTYAYIVITPTTTGPGTLCPVFTIRID